MSSEIAAKRYAKALFEIAAEKDQIEKFKSDLLTFKEHSDSGSINFLSNPVFSMKEKISVLEKLYTKEKFSKDFKNFFNILIEEKRTEEIPDIYSYFVRFVNEYRKQETAKVYSAVSLSTDQKKSLAKALSKSRGKDVIIENILDESVIGGLKITIGSFLYDGSVKGYIEKFKTRI